MALMKFTKRFNTICPGDFSKGTADGAFQMESANVITNGTNSRLRERETPP